MTEPTATGRITSVIREADIAFAPRKCMAPAPAVVNGAMYVGCELEPGHDGMHKTTVEWT